MSDSQKQFPSSPENKKEQPQPTTIDLPGFLMHGTWLPSSPCDARYVLSQSKYQLMDYTQFEDAKRCQAPVVYDLLDSSGKDLPNIALGLACLPQTEQILLVTQTHFCLYDQQAIEAAVPSKYKGEPTPIKCRYIYPLMMGKADEWESKSARLHVFPNEQQFCVVRLDSSYIGIGHLDRDIEHKAFGLAKHTIVDSEFIAPHYLALIQKDFTPPSVGPKLEFLDINYKHKLDKYNQEMKKYDRDEQQRKTKEAESTAIYLYDTRKAADIYDYDVKKNTAFLAEGHKLCALPNLTSITAAPGGRWIMVTQEPPQDRAEKLVMGQLTVYGIIPPEKKDSMPTTKQLAKFAFNPFVKPRIVNGKVIFCGDSQQVLSVDPLNPTIPPQEIVPGAKNGPVFSLCSTVMGLCLKLESTHFMLLYPKSLEPLVEAVHEGAPRLSRPLVSLIAHYVGGFWSRENFPAESTPKSVPKAIKPPIEVESLEAKKANILREIHGLIDKYEPTSDRKDGDRKNTWHAELKLLLATLQKKDQNFANAIRDFCPNLDKLVAPEKRKGLLGIFAGGGDQNQDENNLAALMEKIRNLDVLQRALKK